MAMVTADLARPESGTAKRPMSAIMSREAAVSNDTYPTNSAKPTLPRR